MRGTRVKTLRTDERPHPGRLHGGSVGRDKRRVRSSISFKRWPKRLSTVSQRHRRPKNEPRQKFVQLPSALTPRPSGSSAAPSKAKDTTKKNGAVRSFFRRIFKRKS